MSEPTACTLCKSTSSPIEWNGACQTCLKRLGFRLPIPTADPPRAGCARCGHRTLVRVLMRERTNVGGGEQELAPMAVTFGVSFTPHLIGGGQTINELPSKPYGVMEARVCRACGFTDLYVQNPGQIPIGAAFGTEELTIPDEPYR
jgi:hypothetical protein